MKKSIILMLCLNSIFILGQQTGTFYFSIHGEPCDKNAAKTKYVISSSDKKLYKEKISMKIDNNWEPQTNFYTTYSFENDSDIIIKTYFNNKISDTKKRVFRKQNDSLFSFVDFKNDSFISMKGTALSLLPMKWHGEVEEFYKNGNKRFVAIYKSNRLISNLRWKENGEKDISDVFNYEEAEVEPTLSMGSIPEFIGKELKYPEEAMKQNIQGRVVMQIIVMEDGSIEGVNVLKSVHPLLDSEGIRVLKSTDKKWNPGKIDNKPVRVSVILPINFRL